MADNTVPPTDEVPVTPDETGEQPANKHAPGGGNSSEDIGPRLERLGGEPAPDITPEEFARLQQAGQIQIDPRERVRATQRDESSQGI